MVALALIGYCVVAVLYLSFSRSVSTSEWWSASREPAGLAPDPRVTREAVVQVYAARTVGWRGYIGVHTWIAVKRLDVRQFVVHEVIGYRLRSGNVVVSSNRHADGHWFGAKPELLKDVRGEGVDELIDKIELAVRRYPYADRYRVWPGPNSNTFVAWVLREVPQLRADLPATAIGKDYLGRLPLRVTPSGTGLQFNLLGVFGLLIGWHEGLELNILGLTFGIDFKRIGIKLPLIGRISLLGKHVPSKLQPGSEAPPKTL